MMVEVEKKSEVKSDHRQSVIYIIQSLESFVFFVVDVIVAVVDVVVAVVSHRIFELWTMDTPFPKSQRREIRLWVRAAENTQRKKVREKCGV